MCILLNQHRCAGRNLVLAERMQKTHGTVAGVGPATAQRCPCPTHIHPSLPVHVVQPNEHLLRQVAHHGDGNAPVVKPLDEGQQVLPEHLKDEANVAPVWANVLKVVIQSHAVVVVFRVLVAQLGEKCDLIPRCLRVVLSALLDLQVISTVL